MDLTLSSAQYLQQEAVLGAEEVTLNQYVLEKRVVVLAVVLYLMAVRLV